MFNYFLEVFMYEVTPAAMPLIAQRFSVNYSPFPLFLFHIFVVKYYRLVIKISEREVKSKEWKCVQVGHHKNVAEGIEEYQKEGWHLHTYSSAGTAGEVKHYLLFEKGE